MTNDAVKRAFEAYWDALRSHPFIEMDRDMDAAMDDYEAGWNACKAHHYAEVHELREALRIVKKAHETGRYEPAHVAYQHVCNLLAKGDDNVG